MTNRLKYVALITVNGITYEYYGNSNYEFGLIEEKPTIKINGDHVENYPFVHTLNLIPLYSTNYEIPKNLSTPLNFMVKDYLIHIEKVYKTGGEAIIYQGTLNQFPVLFRKYVRLTRKLRLLPPEINKYMPKKYLLFNDNEEIPILVMEHLQELIFTDKIYEQSLLFLQQMESLNEVHGDISPGNVMQDNEGNLKLIDFSRSKLNIGTSFYSENRTDKQSMAIVLLNSKYSALIKNYSDTLAKLYILKQMDEIQFFKWFESTFPQDQQSYTLLNMIR